MSPSRNISKGNLKQIKTKFKVTIKKKKQKKFNGKNVYFNQEVYFF